MCRYLDKKGDVQKLTLKMKVPPGFVRFKHGPTVRRVLDMKRFTIQCIVLCALVWHIKQEACEKTKLKYMYLYLG